MILRSLRPLALVLSIALAGCAAAPSRVDPFDDPFVGAALLTDDGELIASHRKETHHEPHAEAITLIAALEQIDGPDAQKLRTTIKDSYEQKTWLQSEQQQERFVECFRQAGDFVRNFVRKSREYAKLILISTLEPCRDFENQPGCAHLISAFKPDLVLYACDDTNAKGQGAPILKKSGVQLLGNLAVERNVEINMLFYASVHYIKRLHRASRSASDQFGVRYIVVQLDRLTPRIEWEETRAQEGRRLRLSFEDSMVPVYQAPLEVRAPTQHLEDLPLDLETVDVNRLILIFSTGHFC